MDTQIFADVLDCANRLESIAMEQFGYRMLLLSGGECTEHPDLVTMIEMAFAQGWFVYLLTNGMWLGQEGMRDRILRPDWPNMMIQVTNDPRFYPKRPPMQSIADPRIVWVDSLSLLTPLGRFKGKKHEELPMRQAPTCFNLRSFARETRDITVAIALLRGRAMQSYAGHCIPSIDINGTVRAGETNKCHAIGTIHSTQEEMTEALVSMRCDECGLVNNLTQVHKRAIGESMLFIPGELTR